MSYDEEPGRRVTDACYHCSTSGEVDDETDRYDRLMALATAFAEDDEQAYRDWSNGPDGDGEYDLGAAERGLHPHEYFKIAVWDRADRHFPKLLEMPRESQDLLLAWINEPRVASAYAPKPAPSTIPSPPPFPAAREADDIPF